MNMFVCTYVYASHGTNAQKCTAVVKMLPVNRPEHAVTFQESVGVSRIPKDVRLARC
jgi:hypothetical protein